jgi:hypothetical protein
MKLQKNGNFPANLVLNEDQMGFFWKWTPLSMFTYEDKENTLGFKPSWGWLTVQQCNSASGNVKLSPPLVYHSAMPHAMCGYSNVCNLLICLILHLLFCKKYQTYPSAPPSNIYILRLRLIWLSWSLGAYPILLEYILWNPW